MTFFKVGAVEKRIYELRSEHPLVIPQLDPDKRTEDEIIRDMKIIEKTGISHVALGGTIVDTAVLQKSLEIMTKDFDFTVVTYLMNSTTCLVEGIKDKTAIYWMTVLNSENPFYLKDNLVMSSRAIASKFLEPLPTAYIFDDRGEIATSSWISRPMSVPRNKPNISLSIALASQFLGIRFYIMAGGSGVSLSPPEDHVELLRKKTDLFLIPTSGIKTAEQATHLFDAGADALHIGQILEEKNGLKHFDKMVKASKKYPGKDFM